MVHYLKLIIIFGLGVLSLVACSDATPSATSDVKPDSTVTVAPDDPELLAPTALPSPTATEEPRSTLNAGEEDIKGQIVRLWHPWSGEQADTLEKLVDTFNATNNWGVEVQATGVGDFDQLWNEIAAARQSDEAPDIAVGYLHQILAADASEPVVDLENFIQDPVWGLSQEEQSDFFPVFWQADKIGTRRLGLPALRSAQLIYYNSTWAKELGFESPPTSPEEFAEQACAAAEANLQDENPDNDGTGGAIISIHYASTLGWLKAFGAPVVNEDHSGYLFDEPGTENALRFLRQLYEDGCAWLPESEFTEVEFAAREGLFRTDTLTAIPHQEMAFSRLENKDVWSALAFPSPQEKPAMPVYGPSYALLTSTPEKQLAAWSFLRWLAQPENEAQMAFANGSLPLRVTTLEQLRRSDVTPDQWAGALDAIALASSEPPFASWAQVRWALQDATTQLYRNYFTMDGIPQMIDFLQETASDLLTRYDLQEEFDR